MINKENETFLPKNLNEQIFNVLKDIIKDTSIEGFNINNIILEKEKLSNCELKTGHSYKVFINNVLLKYTPMKKKNDTIEIRYLNNEMFLRVKEKFKNVSFNKEKDIYIKIDITSADELFKISEEIIEIYKFLFIQFITQKESFGCCSRYEQCSDNLKCIQEDLRIRLGCIYKTNLENKRIFYGKNKNV